ncbi:hypothetical protein [Nostoc sp.]
MSNPPKPKPQPKPVAKEDPNEHITDPNINEHNPNPDGKPQAITKN